MHFPMFNEIRTLGDSAQVFSLLLVFGYVPYCYCLAEVLYTCGSGTLLSIEGKKVLADEWFSLY